MLAIVGMGRKGDNVSADEEYDWNEGVKVEGGLVHTVGRPLAGYRLGHLASSPACLPATPLRPQG